MFTYKHWIEGISKIYCGGGAYLLSVSKKSAKRKSIKFIMGCMQRKCNTVSRRCTWLDSTNFLLFLLVVHIASFRYGSLGGEGCNVQKKLLPMIHVLDLVSETKLASLPEGETIFYLLILLHLKIELYLLFQCIDI